MLEHLFGSRTRVKLLTLFLHHPEDSFYVRELTRKISTQINAVRREIQNLVDLGMVIEGFAIENESLKKRPGLKRKYYKANKQFPLMKEIGLLLTKAHILLERKLDDRVKKIGDVRYAALMGSFLGSPNQKVDMFLVGRIEDANIKKLVADLEAELGFEINYSIMTTQEFIYRRDLADRFIHSILQSPKHVILDLLDEAGGAK